MWSWICDELFCCVGKEREIQKSYWEENSTDLTVESMMLDSKASDLDKEERPEVDFVFRFLCICVFEFGTTYNER